MSRNLNEMIKFIFGTSHNQFRFCVSIDKLQEYIHVRFSKAEKDLKIAKEMKSALVELEKDKNKQ